MSVDFRLPNINGKTDSEKISQITRYIYRLTEQLNFSVNSAENERNAFRIETSSSAGAAEEERKMSEAYSAVKSMIVKSADFIKSVSDEISVRLEGEYLAKSEFGKFEEKTSADISANSTALTQLYSYTSNIRSDYADFDVENKSYIKTGLLYENGSQPVYGVGVGLLRTQTNTNGTLVIDRENLATTFTADRISFWGNDTELAYITPTHVYFPQGTLTAYGATITGNITAQTGSIAGFDIDGDTLKGVHVGMCGVSGKDFAFWAGGDTGSTAPFRVSHDGAFSATRGEVGGWTINETGLFHTLISPDKTVAYEVSISTFLNEEVGNTFAQHIDNSTSFLVKENGTPVFYIRPNGDAMIGGFEFSFADGMSILRQGNGVTMRSYEVVGYRDNGSVISDWYDICDASQFIKNNKQTLLTLLQNAGG